MKKLKGSMAAKTIAVILFCALCLGFAASAVAAGMLYSAGFYSRGAAAARGDLAQSLCADEAGNIADRVYPVKSDGGNNAFLADSANYRYEIYDCDGVLRASNYTGEETIAVVTRTETDWFPYDAFPEGTLWGEEAQTEEAAEAAPSAEPLPTPVPDGAESVAVPTTPPRTRADPNPTPRVVDSVTSPGDVSSWYDRQVNYTVTCYLLRELTQRDGAAFQLGCFDFAAANDQLLIGAAAACLLLAIAVFVFLLCAAGHRKGTDEIRASFIEKIPFDLFTVLIFTAGAYILYAFGEILDHLNREIGFRLAVAALLFVLAALLGLWWCMSLAVRVKQKTLVRGTLIYKLLHFLLRAAVVLWGWLKMLVTNLPLVWRGLLILCAAEFVGFVILMANYRKAGATGFAINLFVFFPLALWGLISAKRLRRGAQEIAAGHTDYTVPTKYLLGEFKAHADDLNAIRSGISRAVEERMRSERMKTELITNVSHDIKTPLTSIISYVDLLSKEEIGSEQAKEYIEVLQRQSARLKKLTDDLVEASKASSGALGVTIEDCDLGVMLEQTAGEYGEKLAQKNLELIVRRPDREIMARADARHTQRIFDNLMSNILKYALPGTRVYLELTENERGPAVIFRNTSRSEIVQSPEELTERFVRGDSARSSEGSGLGLSIARSLAELQGGSLAVTVDGDLFKVTLGFAK